MSNPHVLFLCTENSCRSQLAEAWLQYLGRGRVTVSSAGSEPGVMNPMTVAAMEEVGVGMGEQHPKGLGDVALETVTHVVTLCGGAEAQCPAFAGHVVRLHWPIPDPKELTLAFPTLVNDGFRAVRDNIRDRVTMLLIQLEQDAEKAQ